MLMPQSKMRAMLQRNNLAQSWNPGIARRIIESAQVALADAERRLINITGAKDDESIDPIPDMDMFQQSLGDTIVSALLAASQVGLDATMLFSMATTAEETGTDAFKSYTGVSRAALLTAWGSERHVQLGFHPRSAG